MAFTLDAKIRISGIEGLNALKQQLAQATQNINIGTNVKGTKGLQANTAALKLNAQESAKAAKAQKELTEQLKKGQGAIKKSTKAVTTGTKSAKNFASSIFLAAKRYSAFVVATSVPLALIASLTAATKAVVDFDSAIVALDQILSPTQARLDEFRQTIIKLSTETGTAASEIAKAAKILAQAGVLTEGVDLAAALRPLAQAPLLPTVENIEEATEGILAFSKQFDISITESAGILSKLNEVSKQFAVEVDDLVAAAKRGGGAFAQFGGSLDEFVGLVTAIRARTRESASSIGTALRTISTRIFSEKTLTTLKGFNIAVRNQNGELLSQIGILKNVAARFQNLTKIEQVEVGQALAGRRQIGKLIAALGDFGEVEKAIEASRSASGGLEKDVKKATESLAGQFNILKAELNAVVQALSGPVFAPAIEGLTTLARAFVSLFTVVEPLVPVLTTFFSLLAGAKLFSFAGKLAGLSGAFATLGAVAGGRASFTTPGKPGSAGAFGAAAAGSSFAQVAAVGGIVVGIDALVTALGESNSVSAEIIRKLSQAIGALVAFNILVKKQSLGQAVKGLTLGAGAAGTAAIAGVTTAVVAGLAIAVNSANTLADEMDKKIKETQAAIAGISVDEVGLETATEQFVNKFKDFAAQSNAILDVSLGEALTSFEGFGKALGILFIKFKKAVDRIKKLDFLGAAKAFFTPVIDKGASQKILDGFVKQNLDIFARLIGESLNEGGEDFRQQLRERIQAGGLGEGPVGKNQASDIVDSVIRQFGGLGKALARAKVFAELENLGKTSSTVSQALKEVLIAKKVGVQLLAFGKALSKSLGALDVGLTIAERLEKAGQGEISRIEPITAKDVIGEVTKTGSFESLGIKPGDIAPELEAQAVEIFKLFESVEEFAAFIQGLDIDVLLKEAKGDPKLINEAVRSGLEGLKDIPDSVKERFSLLVPDILKKVIEKQAEGLAIDEKELDTIIKGVIGGATFFQKFADGIAQGRNASEKRLFEIGKRQAAINTLAFEFAIKDLNPAKAFDILVSELTNLGIITEREGEELRGFKDNLDGLNTAEATKLLASLAETMTRLPTAGKKTAINFDLISKSLEKVRTTQEALAKDPGNEKLRIEAIEAAKAAQEVSTAFSHLTQVLELAKTATGSVADAEASALKQKQDALKGTRGQQQATREAARQEGVINQRKLDTQRIIDRISKETAKSSGEEQIKALQNVQDPLKATLINFNQGADNILAGSKIFQEAALKFLSIAQVEDPKTAGVEEKRIRGEAKVAAFTAGRSIDILADEFSKKLVDAQIQPKGFDVIESFIRTIPFLFSGKEITPEDISPQEQVIKDVLPEFIQTLLARALESAGAKPGGTEQEQARAAELAKELLPAITKLANIILQVSEGEITARQGEIAGGQIKTPLEINQQIIDLLSQQKTQEQIAGARERQEVLIANPEVLTQPTNEKSQEASDALKQTFQDEMGKTRETFERFLPEEGKGTIPEVDGNGGDITAANTTELQNVTAKQEELRGATADATEAMRALEKGVDLDVKTLNTVDVAVNIADSFQQAKGLLIETFQTIMDDAVSQFATLLASNADNVEDAQGLA